MIDRPVSYGLPTEGTLFVNVGCGRRPVLGHSRHWNRVREMAVVQQTAAVDVAKIRVQG